MTLRFDASRHAVFEASAGTGKTHRIGLIVTKLVLHQSCTLDQLLVVTFTEKATGELKTRLRGDLEKAIANDRERGPAVQSQLDQFDRASISTIHGFCKRLLDDHAADLGQDFYSELVSDAALVNQILRDVQRQDWPRRFGAELASVLQAAGFHRDSASTWQKKVEGLLRKYRPECSHRLVPAPSEDAGPETLMAYTIERVRERLRDRKRQLGQMSFDDQIERVAAGLDPACNPRAAVVIEAVRKQFRFAIVDEFQDTDPLQWAIFRRLFLDGGDSRLIVVGDPKQAIYGFRGADLPTYLDAVEEMSGRAAAQVHRLGINWRATPEMIASLNTLIGAGELFPPEGRIQYVPVEPPPEAQRQIAIATDHSGRNAVTILDVHGDDDRSATAARSMFASFTAREIRRLLEPGVVRVRDRKGERPLSASDIAVLVFRHAEADVFAAALARERIPVSQKASGVRRSSQARDIRLVLRALAHPDRSGHFTRALLTMFFRVSPQTLMAAESVGAEHPARVLFEKWKALADARSWSGLFTSMLEESGVLFHERDAVDYDRRVANLKHLFGQLQETAYQSNLDLHELLDAFAVTDDEDDPQPKESDEPGVQIMTIFAAKGLEFPVVFLGGGFTNGRNQEMAYRDEGRLVFDLPYLAKRDKNDWRTQRIEEERASEQRRLLYVALTRAQFKLYLPVMKSKPKADKAAIPLLLEPAVARSGMKSVSLDDRVEARGDKLPSLSDRKAVAAIPDKLGSLSPRRVDPLFPEWDATISGRRTFVTSFSGMHAAQKRERGDKFGEARERVDEKPEAIVELSDPFRGATFGELVHEIFERVDFAEVAAADEERRLDGGPLDRMIETEVAHFLPRLVTRAPDDRLAAECRAVVRRMVWQALRAPLNPAGVRVCDVPAADCLRELEFLYPQALKPGESPTLIKGFMDLVFRWHGQYYLLDWKTNVLPAYDAAALEAGMTEAGYHLQYQLYCEALSRWLRGSKLRIGGVFYVFLRGLENGGGVYYAPGTVGLPRK